MQQGKILKYSADGLGLITSSSGKYEFNLEQHWCSPVVPKPDMVVSFTLNNQEKLAKVYAGDIQNALPVGVVLKDGQVGEGLVICEGRKYRFTLENEWQIDAAATTGMRVCVETDEAGRLVKITQAPAGFAAIKNIQLPGGFDAKNINLSQVQGVLSQYNGVLDRIPVANLVLFFVMILGWYAFNTLTVGGMVRVSFADILSGIGSSDLTSMMRGDTSFFNVISWVALLAIFLPAVLKKPVAKLGVFAPLALMVVITVWGLYEVYSAAKELGRMFGSNGAALSQKMLSENLKLSYLGFGAWLSLIAASVGAFFAMKMENPSIAQLLAKFGVMGSPSSLSTTVEQNGFSNFEKARARKQAEEQQNFVQPPVEQPPVAQPQPVQPPAVLENACLNPFQPKVPQVPLTNCPKCDAKVESEDLFCGTCGHRLNRD